MWGKCKCMIHYVYFICCRTSWAKGFYPLYDVHCTTPVNTQHGSRCLCHCLSIVEQQTSQEYLLHVKHSLLIWTHSLIHCLIQSYWYQNSLCWTPGQQHTHAYAESRSCTVSCRCWWAYSVSLAFQAKLHCHSAQCWHYNHAGMLTQSLMCSCSV